MAEWKKTLKQIWNFVWNDDGIWSWLVNIVLAFILIKFLVYPGLAFLLGTTHPVVAVVSESMEHNANFDDWWDKANGRYIVNNQVVENWYINIGIKKEDFIGFPLKNGFNKGDIMVLHGKTPKDIKIGDVTVYWSARKVPIIHRVVKKWQENGVYYFQTKGDNNHISIKDPSLDETRISQDKVIGNAVFKVPFLGYIKIWFVDYIANPIISLKNG